MTVGQNTARLAQEAGAEAVMLGETGAELLENAHKIDGPALICRGVHARLDLVQGLAERGIEASEAIVYDQVPQDLSEAARDLLAGENMVVAPVFSPRSATLLSAQSISAPIRVLAISRATADAWIGPGKVEVADRPTSAAMCDLLAVTL